MKSKLTIIFLVFITTTFIIVMFMLSNQNGVDSVKRSSKLVDRFIDFLNIRDVLKEYPVLFINRNNIFRKAIHFTEYMFLGIFVFCIIKTANIHKRKMFYITIPICLIISVLDETYQSFVPARTPLITDVVIDVSGSVFGLLICLLLTKMFILFKLKIHDLHKIR